MNADLGVVIGAIGISATVCGWVIRGARSAERFQQTQAQAKKDADGLGRLVREEIARQQRRWLHEVADRVQEAATPEMRNRLADRIRQEAFRN